MKALALPLLLLLLLQVPDAAVGRPTPTYVRTVRRKQPNYTKA